ncbi:MAG: mannose-1-phosphate guanylyltransferase [Candidatus Aminicenantes bacterium]|nr:mannose-1-phosphate guanylyltransferase [Candidatus Aminicenantes bacterium]
MDIHAVIMAGGSGTRFWPLSRQKKPKQFLAITSERTMIEETVQRLLPLIPRKKIYTIANESQTKIIKSLLNLPEENYLMEPQARNTAPSLILATAHIFLQNPDAVLAFLPADHMIINTSLFLKKLTAAAEAAGTGKHLLTFGIPPNFPATGYGYIQFSSEKTQIFLGEQFYPVRRFKEKPHRIQAQEFLKDGNYFWNSGMFLWKAKVFAHMLKTYSPDMFFFWEQMCESLKSKSQQMLMDIFEKIPSISIDFALMEKAKGVLMCEGGFGWSDVGSWSSLTDIWPRDAGGNALKGSGIFLDSNNCLLYSPHKLTALVGIEDIIVVDTEDALLICHKDRDQKVKEIVDNLLKTKKPLT